MCLLHNGNEICFLVRSFPSTLRKLRFPISPSEGSISFTTSFTFVYRFTRLGW
jgi:hypothetical protein